LSTIRLEDVSVIYSRSTMLGTRAFNRGVTGSQSDRAFAERVRAQADIASAADPEQTKIAALDHVNLTIPDGRTVAVVGPSGCGKSTLLRVIAGLVADYKGRIYYDDQDMKEIPPKDRYIGMVFQSYALYPHFRGRGNLSFFFKIHKAPDQETEARIRETSEIMGIGFDELLQRKPGTLSGGQQQRVAIGRAIVRSPRLFLFDEPLSSLDAKLRTQTRVEIKRLLRRFQITSIYVTHDQVEATTLGDQIAVMRQGQIEQMDTFHNLLQDPANAFVAGFLGSPPMNILRGGTVVDGVLHVGTLAVPLPENIRDQTHPNQQLLLGIRPDAARLVAAGDEPSPHPRQSGTVESIEPDFSRNTQLAYVRTDDLFYAAQGPLDQMANIGDNVDVEFPLDSLYFFDAASEQRIRQAFSSSAPQRV